jgi:SAM-dependent methyltransferase
MPIIALRSSKHGQSTSQCQKPSGPLGRLNLWAMNRRHSKLTDWGLANVTIAERDVMLDVGCGGGRTIAKLAAAAPAGRVYGIDYAPASIAVARRTNRQLVESGRVVIEEASVSALPFAPDTFDLVTAIETHFWWGDALGPGMREVWRVLRPGGRFLIVAEFYNGGRHSRYAERLGQLTGMAALTVEQHRALLVDAGFSDARLVEDERRGWISAMGTRHAMSTRPSP